MFPLFPLGQIVATPGALAALERAKQTPTRFLARHAIGDWGELEPTDVAENKYSVVHGFRLLSSYQTDAGEKLVDNHRSRPVGNYSALARGVLPSCLKSDHWFRSNRLRVHLIHVQAATPCRASRDYRDRPTSQSLQEKTSCSNKNIHIPFNNLAR